MPICEHCGTECEEEDFDEETDIGEVLSMIFMQLRAVQELCIGKKVFSEKAFDDKMRSIIDEMNDKAEKAYEESLTKGLIRSDKKMLS